VTIVLDASATLASFFRDERTPAIGALFERVARIGAIAPAIWPLEVANGLQMAVRRSRVDAAFRSVALRDLAAFPIVLDSETSTAAWTTLPPIADLHGLTIYDAAYLELALRKGSALASIDKKLRAAGAASGLELLGI
jgi:predicted nucleic acid-binding protein